MRFFPIMVLIVFVGGCGGTKITPVAPSSISNAATLIYTLCGGYSNSTNFNSPCEPFASVPVRRNQTLIVTAGRSYELQIFVFHSARESCRIFGFAYSDAPRFGTVPFNRDERFMNIISPSPLYWGGYRFTAGEVHQIGIKFSNSCDPQLPNEVINFTTLSP